MSEDDPAGTAVWRALETPRRRGGGRRGMSEEITAALGGGKTLR
jgi:hypothetical protein